MHDDPKTLSSDTQSEFVPEVSGFALVKHDVIFGHTIWQGESREVIYNKIEVFDAVSGFQEYCHVPFGFECVSGDAVSGFSPVF